jgi:hypothetical protein
MFGPLVGGAGRSRRDYFPAEEIDQAREKGQQTERDCNGNTSILADLPSFMWIDTCI